MSENKDIPIEILMGRLTSQYIHFCIYCDRGLPFESYYERHKENYSLDQLITLWKSPHVKLFCCVCLDNIIEGHEDREIIMDNIVLREDFKKRRRNDGINKRRP